MATHTIRGDARSILSHPIDVISSRSDDPEELTCFTITFGSLKKMKAFVIPSNWVRFQFLDYWGASRSVDNSDSAIEVHLYVDARRTVIQDEKEMKADLLLLNNLRARFPTATYESSASRRRMTSELFRRLSPSMNWKDSANHKAKRKPKDC